MTGSASVRFTLVSDAYVSGRIGEDFFGANFLAGRDALDGSFAAKAAALGVSHLRWPGGGIAEKHFDLLDPDTLPQARNGSETTLSAYLAFSAAQGMRPVIVLPTKRFAADVPGAVGELEVFLRNLADGAYGPTEGLLLEVGNEYYSGSGPHAAISAAQYGALARAYVDAIERVLPTAEIAVQIGRTPKANDRIQAAFDDQTAASAIDTLVFHEYPWRLEPIGARIAGKMALAGDWTALGVDAEIYMSEWNVGSNPDETLDYRHDYGHAQLSTMLEIVGQSIAQGVDMASVWAIQQINKTSLAADEGRPEIFAAGELFRMMQESIPGKRMIDFDDDALAVRGVHVQAYGNESELSLFIAARDLAQDSITVRLELPDLGSALSFAWGERLIPLGDPLDYRPEARLVSFLQPLGGEESIAVRFNRDYEIVRLDFALGSDIQPGRTLMGDSADNVLRSSIGSDRLVGAPGDDLLLGGGGHDRLIGGTGNDRQIGGSGRDLLHGQTGNDVLAGGIDSDILFGQDGTDRLLGGAGADRLNGGAGADFLYGQAGDDRLIGGAGLDRLTGGAGRDLFLFFDDFDLDVVIDFEVGADSLHLRGLGIPDFETLEATHLSQRRDGALIVTDEGMILLRGITTDRLSADDFIF